MKLDSTNPFSAAVTTQQPSSLTVAQPRNDGPRVADFFGGGSQGIAAGPGGCIPQPFPFPRPLPVEPRPIPFPHPHPGPIDCFPFPPFPQPSPVTLNRGDRQNAADLKNVLSDPLNQFMGLMDPDAKDLTLKAGKDGVFRGPEGQPLAQVKLDDGSTAYVDPNTNQYYLAEDPAQNGKVEVRGPIDLPPDAEFSNSHFSDADVKAISRLAAKGDGTTLSGRDREKAGSWKYLNPETRGASVTLRAGKDGVFRGPEGQPLVQVQTRSGQTIYVDPNTNQYYTERANVLGIFGGTRASGPHPLPRGMQVSNSHFSDADTQALQREANKPTWRDWLVGPFQPMPMPAPTPFPGGIWGGAGSTVSDFFGGAASLFGIVAGSHGNVR